MNGLKKVLIITYYWPPSGGSGVQRWMYFARYLQEFGIEPTVITVDEKYASYAMTDESLNSKIDQVRVFKTKTLEPLRFYSFLKSGNSKKEIPMGSLRENKKGIVDKLAKYIRGNFFIPDARIGWNRYAFSKAAALIQNEQFDAVITTGPPHSTHLVGLKLKEKFNIRWIADFRDPWTEVYYNSLFQRTQKNQLKDQNLELSVLKAADLVLTIGPSMKALLQAKIPEFKDKVQFIYNGYDHEMVQGIVANKKKRFTVTHIGILSEKQAYLSLINGFKRVFEKHPDIEIDFILAGNVSETVVNDFLAVKEINTKFIGKIPHQEAVQLMFDVHLLTNCLAVQQDSKILISGKLMEYMATGNPILLIGDKEGDAANLLVENAIGMACEPDEIEKIADYIYTCFQSFEAANTSDRNLSRFSRYDTAKSLSELIKELSAGKA